MDVLMKCIAYGLSIHACGRPSNFVVNKALVNDDTVAEYEKHDEERREETKEEDLFLRYHDELFESPKPMPPSHDNQPQPETPQQDLLSQPEPLPQPEPLICYAARNGNVSIIQVLLTHGIYQDTRNEKGKTTLIIASREGHERLVWSLLYEGAYVNALDNTQNSAASYAVENDHLEIIAVLMEHGKTITWAVCEWFMLRKPEL